jgi:uncharacterized RDD family membrane protein YckC
MACANHPEVITGLDTCTACSKTFCIDCLVGRKSGWFCSACDPEPKAAAAPVAAPAAAAAVVVSPPGGGLPEKPKAPSTRACTNHPDVLEKLVPCTRCDRIFCPDCLVELKGSRFCAGCKVNAVKDLQSGVSGSGLMLAGIGQRLVAAIIDALICYAVWFACMMLMGIMMAVAKPDPNSFVPALVGCGVFIAFFAAMLGYQGFMVQWKGQTLGKMAMKIKVVNSDGGAVTPGQAWIRAIVLFLLQFLWITYIPAFFNDEKKTIHDMAARTLVVRIV